MWHYRQSSSPPQAASLITGADGGAGSSQGYTVLSTEFFPQHPHTPPDGEASCPSRTLLNISLARRHRRKTPRLYETLVPTARVIYFFRVGQTLWGLSLELGTYIFPFQALFDLCRFRSRCFVVILYKSFRFLVVRDVVDMTVVRNFCYLLLQLWFN